MHIIYLIIQEWNTMISGTLSIYTFENSKNNKFFLKLKEYVKIDYFHCKLF